MIFYNYQIEYIIELIIIILYGKNKFKNNFYTSPKPYNNNNQVIQLSLVSKFFFQVVSEKLTEILDIQNYFVLKGLIQKINEADGSIIDSKYKLIKVQGSIRCYDYLYTFNQDPISVFIRSNNNNNNSSNSSSSSGNNIFKSIHIGPGNLSYVQDILNNLSTFPSNFKFDLTVSTRDLINSFANKDENSVQDDLNKIRKVILNNNSSSFNNNDYSSRDSRRELFSLLKCCPASIVYSDFIFPQFSCEVSLVFKSNQSLKIQIDSLIFSDEYYHSVGKDQSLSKLDEFKLITTISHLLSKCNTSQQNSGGGNGGNLAESWQVVVNKLLNEKSLVELVINKEEFNLDNGLKNEDVMKGFKTILSSPSCKIQLLSLGGLNDHLVEALAVNNSVKTLVLDGRNNPIAELVQKILFHNKSIRHLEFIETKDDIEVLKLLQDSTCSSKYDLYSISFYFERESIKPYLDLISSYQYTVKEFNFKNIYMGNGLQKKVQYQLVINDSIVNITEYIPTPKVVRKWIVSPGG